MNAKVLTAEAVGIIRNAYNRGECNPEQWAGRMMELLRMLRSGGFDPLDDEDYYAEDEAICRLIATLDAKDAEIKRLRLTRCRIGCGHIGAKP